MIRGEVIGDLQADGTVKLTEAPRYYGFIDGAYLNGRATAPREQSYGRSPIDDLRDQINAMRSAMGPDWWSKADMLVDDMADAISYGHSPYTRAQ